MSRSLRATTGVFALLATLFVAALSCVLIASEAHADADLESADFSKNALVEAQSAGTITGTCGECTWTIEKGLLTIKPTNGVSGTLEEAPSTHDWPWSGYDNEEEGASNLINAVLVAQGVRTGQDASYLFSGLSLDSIDVSGLDTSAATDMSNMFTHTSVTKKARLDFDTSSVTNMSCMFWQSSWEEGWVEGTWDTSSVTNMYGMFYFYNGGSLAFSGWDTSNVTTMESMFWFYRGDSLDIGCFDNRNADCNHMFRFASISELTVGRGFAFSKLREDFDGVSDGSGMPGSAESDYYNENALGVANGGKYWSMEAQQWFTSEQVQEKRSGTADTYRATALHDLSKKGTVTLSQTSYSYDGSEKEPFVTVKYNGDAVPSGSYDVAYSNNTNVGTATATVTGKGDYTGSKSATFTIGQDSIESATVTLSPTSYSYDGKAKEPDVTVQLNGKTLVRDTDYTVAYSNNVKAGTATATVTGKGSYTGSKSISFTIGKESIASATVTLSPTSYSFDGRAKTPDVTVKLDGKTLAQGTDYTVSYSNNTAVGTATATVTGKGGYTGSKSAAFEITQASIETAIVTLTPKSFAYDGKAKEPTVMVRLGGDLLAQGVDYTVSYSNNTAVGTATATVTGKGDFTGTAKAEFAITSTSETVWRLYDKSTGEHHYTKDSHERLVLISHYGWTDEGVAWVTPPASSTPVYRVYDLWTGEHHYTSDANEYEELVDSGRWRDEGIAWYSDDAKTAPVYRLERHDRGPLQHHHYTLDEKERSVCLKQWGWNDENIGWYALAAK